MTAQHPNTFHLIIASVGGTAFDGNVVSATLPGESGAFTVLPDHEPFVTTLKPGSIIIKEQLGEKTFSIEKGILECANNRVTVLL